VSSRLTKQDIFNFAPLGSDYVNLRVKEKIIDEASNLLQRGEMTPDLEMRLLVEYGLKPEWIENLRHGTENLRIGQSRYSSALEYVIHEKFPMEKDFCNNRQRAKNNMNRVLGSDIY